MDGPLPTHYEPQESPFTNPLYGQQRNPVRHLLQPHPDNRYGPSGTEPGADVYPFVATTYRLTEHHTAGGMSRWQPYLAELQPEFFCEVSPELAARRRLEHGGWATIVSPRAVVEARVLVTRRMQPSSWTAGRCTRSACPTTGARTATAPVTPRTSCCTSPWIEHPHPGGEGAVGRHPAGAPAARRGGRGAGPRVPGARRRHGPDGHRGLADTVV